MNFLRNTAILICLALSAVLLIGDQEPAKRIHNSKSVSTTDISVQSYTAQIDTLTGKLVTDQSPLSIPDSPAPTSATSNYSDSGLVVEQTHSGGKMVFLQGRFQNKISLNIDSNGAVNSTCQTTHADLGAPRDKQAVNGSGASK